MILSFVHDSISNSNLPRLAIKGALELLYTDDIDSTVFFFSWVYTYATASGWVYEWLNSTLE